MFEIPAAASNAGEAPQSIIPIATLDCTLVPTQSATIKAVVNLIWPYSSQTRSLALSLSEPDFRLRRRRGQVRAVFRGVPAVRLAASKIGIGDEVELSLAGACWTEPFLSVATPGTRVESDLLFQSQFSIAISAQDGSSSRIAASTLDTLNEPAEDSAAADTVPPATARQQPANAFVTPIKPRESLENGSAWSPLKLSQRATRTPFSFSPHLDSFFNEPDDFLQSKGRKRTKFGRKSGEWRLAEASPPKSPGADDPASVALFPPGHWFDYAPKPPAGHDDVAPDVQSPISTSLMESENAASPESSRSIVTKPDEPLGLDDDASDLSQNDTPAPKRRDKVVRLDDSIERLQETKVPRRPQLEPVPASTLPLGSPLPSDLAAPMPLSSRLDLERVAQSTPSLAVDELSIDEPDGPGQPPPQEVIEIIGQHDMQEVTFEMTDQVQHRPQNLTDISEEPQDRFGSFEIVEQLRPELVPVEAEQYKPEEDKGPVEQAVPASIDPELDDATVVVQERAADEPKDLEESEASSRYPLADLAGLFGSSFQQTDTKASLPSPQTLQQKAPESPVATPTTNRTTVLREPPDTTGDTPASLHDNEIFDELLVPSPTQDRQLSFVETSSALEDLPDTPSKAPKAKPEPELKPLMVLATPEDSQHAQAMESSVPAHPVDQLSGGRLPLTPRQTRSNLSEMVDAAPASHVQADEPSLKTRDEQPADFAGRQEERQILDAKAQEDNRNEAANSQAELRQITNEVAATRISEEAPVPISPWFNVKKSALRRSSTRKSTRLSLESAVGKPAPKPREPAAADTPKTAPETTDTLKATPTGLSKSGLRTKLSYYAPLSSLDTYLTASSSQGAVTIDVFAVVTSATSAPVRAKRGPRDYSISANVVDPTTFPSSANVQCFRPSSESLPEAKAGDVLILRDFTVRTRRHACFLISADASAWLVWRYADNGQGEDSTVAVEECRGPPVEIDKEERAHALSLRNWWLRSQQ